MTERRSKPSLDDLGDRTSGLAPDPALTDEVLLRAAADATRELDADPALADAVLARVDLAALADATADLDADAGIGDAVMSRLAAEPEGAGADTGPATIAPATIGPATIHIVPRSPGGWSQFWRSGRAALVAAAAVAASTVVYAGYVETSVDTTAIAGLGSVEGE